MLQISDIAHRSMHLARAVNEQIDQSKAISVDDVRALAAAVAQLAHACQFMAGNVKILNDLTTILASIHSTQSQELAKSLLSFERINFAKLAALTPEEYREWLSRQVRFEIDAQSAQPDEPDSQTRE